MHVNANFEHTRVGRRYYVSMLTKPEEPTENEMKKWYLVT